LPARDFNLKAWDHHLRWFGFHTINVDFSTIDRVTRQASGFKESSSP
jgi:hypothetical protein